MSGTPYLDGDTIELSHQFLRNARTIPSKTGRPFSLSMRGRYRLADLCQWTGNNEEDQQLLAKILLTVGHGGKRATAAGSHVLVTGENFMWAVNLLPSAKRGGQTQ